MYPTFEHLTAGSRSDIVLGRLPTTITGMVVDTLPIAPDSCEIRVLNQEPTHCGFPLSVYAVDALPRPVNGSQQVSGFPWSLSDSLKRMVHEIPCIGQQLSPLDATPWTSCNGMRETRRPQQHSLSLIGPKVARVGPVKAAAEMSSHIRNGFASYSTPSQS